jgi:hypothetical protein
LVFCHEILLWLNLMNKSMLGMTMKTSNVFEEEARD